MRNGLRFLIVVAAFLGGSAEAHAQLGDPVPIAFDTVVDPYVGAALSGPSGGKALIVSGRVLFEDASRRWHRFDIDRNARALRLARLENGGGLAAWDDGREALHVRTWTREGTLGPEQVAMSIGYLGWDLAYDATGTVALLTAGERVAVTVRDPGGAFSAPQDLGVWHPESEVRVSTVVADSRVSITWDRGHWVRPTSEAAFAAALPAAPDPAEIIAEGSQRVRVGPAVRKICADGCTDVKLFTWPGGTARLLDRPGNRVPNVWYLARPRNDGTFDGAVLPSKLQSSQPLWTPRSGVVAFTRPAFPGLALVPYGVAPRRRPSLELISAYTERDKLRIFALCRAACRLSVENGELFSDPGSTGTVAPVKRALEPLEPVEIQIPRPRGPSVRIPYTLRDARGRTARRSLTLRRGTRHHDNRREWLPR